MRLVSSQVVTGDCPECGGRDEVEEFAGGYHCGRCNLAYEGHERSRRAHPAARTRLRVVRPGE